MPARHCHIGFPGAAEIQLTGHSLGRYRFIYFYSAPCVNNHVNYLWLHSVMCHEGCHNATPESDK